VYGVYAIDRVMRALNALNVRASIKRLARFLIPSIVHLNDSFAAGACLIACRCAKITQTRTAEFP
jgi:hypothetical protein